MFTPRSLMLFNLLPVIAVTALLSFSASPVQADFQAGLTAYEKGDYKTALKEWLADAEGGCPVYQRFWYGGTVENLRRALAACPETIFIGHGPGFWREISGDAEANPKVYPDEPVAPGGGVQALLEEHSNLYADLSAGSGRGALARDPDHAREFLHRFADRVMFGRDFYGKDLHEFLQSLDLPTDVSERIYFRNAAGLVGPPAAGR